VYFSIWTDEELCEIPRDLSCFACFFIVQFRIKSKIFIDFIAVFAIDFDLVKKREINVEVSLDVFLDLRVVPWFLPHELIRREG